MAKPVPVKQLRKELRDAGFEKTRTSGSHEFWRNGPVTISLVTTDKDADPAKVVDVRAAIAASRGETQRRPRSQKYIWGDEAEEISEELELDLPSPGSLWIHRGMIYKAVEGPNPETYLYFRSIRPGAIAVPPDDPRATQIIETSQGSVGIAPGGKKSRARIPIGKWPGEWKPGWPPQNDSLWDFVPGGELLWPREPSFVSRVIGMEKGRAQMLDTLTGNVSSVGRREWPGEFLPHYSDEDRRLRAVLVGARGDEKLRELALEAALIGVEILYHVPATNRSRRRWNLPDDVDVAIFYTPDLPSALRRGAFETARKEGVPIAMIFFGKFQAELWEGLRDLYPDEFKVPYRYGSAVHAYPPEQIWQMRDERGWILKDISAESAPPGPPKQGADGLVAMGLVAAAITAGTIMRKRS
jgi:hypothetical protein